MRFLHQLVDRLARQKGRTLLAVVAGGAVVFACDRTGAPTTPPAVSPPPPPPPPVAVAAVEVTPGSAALQVGQTMQLTATPKDASSNALTGRTVVWSSTDGAIATVNATGLVTGKAPGSAKITATSESHSGSADVTVSAAPSPPPPPPPPPPGSVVLVGAGDIADCSSSGDEATALLLDNIAGTVFTAGDNAYSNGSATDYSQCYDPTWGRQKARTRPAPGNHEYNTSGAAPYYAYFGATAGPAGLGYYSYDLGAWHLISLNSNIAMSAGSAQEQWLRADLAANTKQCVLAYWHHPRFSSGSHGSSTAPQPLWQALYDYNADLVISGHDHNYQRFAPQTPTGAADPAARIPIRHVWYISVSSVPLCVLVVIRRPWHRCGS